MKKQIFALVILLSMLIIACTSVSAATYSGSCGDNVAWEYAEGGVLKISGSGAMTNYASASEVPWSGLRSIIYSISVSNGVTSIGDYAFADCYYVTSAILADTVTSIGDYAFSTCEKMAEVNMPVSLTSIGDYAFGSCSAIPSMTIPAGVTSIGDKAFGNCRKLGSINVDANNQYFASENGVLFDKQKQTLLQYPRAKTDAVYTIPNTTTSIGPYAFYKCDNITSVIMGENAESIGNSAFRDCSKLANVTMNSKITSIGEYAFYSSLLESVTIPEGVTCIETYTFAFCHKLTSVTLPEGVTCIETYTFAYCHKLTSVTLPDSLTNISNHAFFDCDALTSITIPENVASIGKFAFYYCEALTEINWNAKNVNDLGNQDGIFAHAGVQGDGITLTIGESVERIPAYAFSPEYGPRYPKITTVIFGNNVTEIGNGAFSDCGSLANITIPDNIVSIGTHAFYGCEALTDLAIGKGVKSIGTSAFSSCTSLVDVTVDENNEYYTSKDSVVFDKQMKTLIMYPIGKTNASYQVPNGVTAIADSAFYYSKILESVAMPNTVESIGDYAFSYCSALTDITLSEKLGNISEGAFNGCIGLINITIPDSVTSIGQSAFWGCDGLISITIPDNVESVGRYAFRHCDALQSITVGKGLKDIGTETFKDCKNLTLINWNAVNANSFSDYNYVFSNAGTNSEGVKIVIGDGVESIPSVAFCPYLSTREVFNVVEVVIGANVKSIGSYAFRNCDNIANVYYAKGEAEWNEISIGNGNEELTDAPRHYDYSSGVTGGGRPPVEATISVDKSGNAEIVIEFVDEALTADNVMVFVAGFSGNKLVSMSELEKELTASGVKYSGKVDNAAKLYIWDTKLSPLAQPMMINY